MSQAQRGSSGVARVLAGRVGPWIVLVLVVWIALGIYGNYRQDVSEQGRARSTEETTSSDATAAADPSGEVAEPADGEGSAPVEPTVIVLIDGLNLRTKPQTSAAVVKKLEKDARLSLLETVDGWYHVRDSVGDEGFVAAGGQYTKLVQER